MWILAKTKKNWSKVDWMFWNIINLMVFILNDVSCGRGMKSRGKIFVHNEGGYICLGKHITLNSSARANPIGSGHRIWIQVKENARLSIGDFVGISNAAITCTERIEIGNHVLIGSGTKIYDTDFHSLCWGSGGGRNGNVKSASIEIGDGVFIGADVIILKGVTIGKGSVVGAGAVVATDIPEYQVWGGNPARFIRDLKIRGT